MTSSVGGGPSKGSTSGRFRATGSPRSRSVSEHSPCQKRGRRVDKGSVTDAATAADPASGYEPDPRRWKALSVTLVAGFMSLLDVSIVAVALPSIQRGLGTSPSRGAVGGLRVRADVRARARPGRAARRRDRAAQDVPRGVGRVRAVQRGGRGGADDRRARRGPAGAGDRRGRARAAELGADPAAVPGRRAGPGVRLLRLDGRALDGGRPDRRRGDPRGGGRARRLAVDLLRQRADRASSPWCSPRG